MADHTTTDRAQLVDALDAAIGRLDNLGQCYLLGYLQAVLAVRDVTPADFTQAVEYAAARQVQRGGAQLTLP